MDFDHGLNKAINKIREALGDSADSRASSKRSLGAATASSPTSERPSPPLLGVRPSPLSLSPPDCAQIADPAGTIAKLTDVFLPPPLEDFDVRPARPAGGSRRMEGLIPATVLRLIIRSLAVLPLDSLSNDASQDYFADGMTDELITDLGRIGALRVISRTSVMVYKHTRKPLKQIAQELNVDAVVEGTVLRSGDQVRITAQLIEAAEDRHCGPRAIKASCAIPSRFRTTWRERLPSRFGSASARKNRRR